MGYTAGKCFHDDFCPLKVPLCQKSDYQEVCRMKNTPLSELKLMEMIKARIERDKARR